MAKQELLKSAFDGKLGGWVGSKYYGKPTIRAYTVPHNPKTEKQKDIRSRFWETNLICNLVADRVGRNTPFYTPKKQILQTLLEKNKTVIAGGQGILTRLRFSSGYLSCWSLNIDEYTDNGALMSLDRKYQRIDVPNMKICAFIINSDYDAAAFGIANIDDMLQGKQLELTGADVNAGPFAVYTCWTFAKKDNCTIGSDTICVGRIIENP